MKHYRVVIQFQHLGAFFFNKSGVSVTCDVTSGETGYVVMTGGSAITERPAWCSCVSWNVVNCCMNNANRSHFSLKSIFCNSSYLHVLYTHNCNRHMRSYHNTSIRRSVSQYSSDWQQTSNYDQRCWWHPHGCGPLWQMDTKFSAVRLLSRSLLNQSKTNFYNTHISNIFGVRKLQTLG